MHARVLCIIIDGVEQVVTGGSLRQAIWYKNDKISYIGHAKGMPGAMPRKKVISLFFFITTSKSQKNCDPLTSWTFFSSELPNRYYFLKLPSLSNTSIKLAQSA